MITFKALDTVDTIKMAIQCEMDMENFYGKLASLIANDDAVAILRGLSEKEEKHRSRLIRFYSRLSGKKILYLNLGKKHKLNTLFKCTDNAVESLRLAKKNENELKNFYLSVCKRFIDTETRELFRDLAMEEEQHIALLESSFVEPINLEQIEGKNEEPLYPALTKADREGIKTW